VNTEEQIKFRLDQIQKEERELRSKLHNLNQNDLYKKKSQYVGKYYRDKEVPTFEKYHSFYYVFGINRDSCRLNVLQLNYCEGNETTHFDIGTYEFFEPEKEEFDKIEIDRLEFKMGYDSVFRRIQKALTAELGNG